MIPYRALQNASETIDVAIPAFNEEASIGLVLDAVPRPPVRRIAVCDNNSTDATAEVARRHGAEVVAESRAGYGSACLAALAHLRETGPPEIVVFLDADYSDHPEELPRVVAPIQAGEADLVIGSRALGDAEPGAMLPQARAGMPTSVRASARLPLKRSTPSWFACPIGSA